MTAVELLPPEQAIPDNPRWHEIRRTGITASEIAAVLGISPWESPFSLYWRKTNGWDAGENEFMSAGQYVEPAVAAWWESQHPYVVVCPAGLYAHPDRPWQLATPDRLLHESCPCCSDGNCSCGLYGNCSDCMNTGLGGPAHALLECKWVAYSWDGWGDQGTDDIPVYYRAQCLWQADVLDVDEVHVAALGPGGFRAYLVRRDEDDLKVMRFAASDFMLRLHAADPPPLDSHSATIDTLKRLHPSVGDGDVEVAADLAEEYRQARADRAAAADRIALCEAQLRAALGSAYSRTTCGGKLVASRSVYERKPYEVGPATIDKLNPGRAASYA